MEALMLIGGAILPPLLESLFHKLSSLRLLDSSGDAHFLSDLHKWEVMLNSIYANLRDAEDRQSNTHSVKLWVSQLKPLAFDLEDILDELATHSLGRNRHVKVRNLEIATMMPCCSAGIDLSNVKFNNLMVSKMEGITKRLEAVTDMKDRLNLSEGDKFIGRVGFVGERSQSISTSLVNERRVYGREEDLKAIIEMLKGEDGFHGGGGAGGGIGVIPIIGMGGMGKTTLAQLVFNDSGLDFDFKCWVSVGEDFDVLRMTKKVLQSFGEGLAVGDLDLVQVKLKEKLFGKKFLIVLDNVWNENYNNWDQFLGPFEVGRPGSRIIVTTRHQSVASMMGTFPVYPLQELSYENCLSVFAQHALGAKNFDRHANLREIGGEIVKRCRGLPLAAKTLGGLLRGKLTHSEWEKVLKSKIWELPEEKSDILPALRLSYYHLPSHLKRCFAYCAIFPKDSEFSKDELVLLWMAEGFLQQSKEEMQTKELGYEYFQELLSRCLFQASSENKSLYVMHDLINDLTRSVSREICFHLDDKLEEGKSYAEVRHSSCTPHHYDIAKRFEVFKEMKNLRTFLALTLLGSQNHNISSWVLDDLVPKLERLRVLSLPHYNIVELPSSIGALKHLRYLNMSYTQIKKLPKSVNELFNLQTLRLCGCRKLLKLPSDLSNLVNLQCLDISGTTSLEEMPLHIGNLTKLHSLTKFIVGSGNGRRITELADLCHLQGQLHVTKLQSVVNIRDVEHVKLKEKQGLDELAFEWIDKFDSSRNEMDELQVLKTLQPQQNVSSVSIRSYGGTVFPSWVGDPSFGNMTFLELRNCRKIILLPPLGQLPSLRYLSIKGMDGVKEVGAEFYGAHSSYVNAFPSLETLNIMDMLEWEQWYSYNDLSQEDAQIFPYLHKLTISNCPKFVGKLPTYLPSLEELNICRCSQLSNLPEILTSLRELKIEECNEVVFRSSPNLTSLTRLEIEKISGLINLNETFIHTLLALEVMEITDCNELKFLCGDSLHLAKLACLKHIAIRECKQLLSLVEGDDGLLPCNLEVLEVHDCNNLKKLPNGMHCLTSLRDMTIYFCKDLVSFPATGLPTSLKNLEIKFCDSLESLPSGILLDANDTNQMSHLERLDIFDCPSITSFPIGELPSSLKSLTFFHGTVKSLQSLCRLSHLTELEIVDSPELELIQEMELHIPNLISLTMWDLRHPPNYLASLVSLRCLRIYNCPGLVCFPQGGLPPNLAVLRIWNCENLTQPMSEWGLHRLTSLRRLQIVGTSLGSEMVSFPDDDGMLLPTSLGFLDLGELKNLKSISRGIRKLTLLKVLFIWSCSKLRYLPKEGLPDTLGCLGIVSCPLLKKPCAKGKGKYWPIIARVPFIGTEFCNTDKDDIEFSAHFDFHLPDWKDWQEINYF